MTRTALSLLALSLLAASACGSCGDDEPMPEAPSAEARPSPARTVETPTAEQLPLPQDYSEYAGQKVTVDTYRAELDRIAAELGEPASPAP